MSAASIPGLVLSAEPRAQLLPPSVKQREKNRAARRMMVLLVILAVVVTGAAVAWGVLRAAQAQLSLLASQQLTEQILEQQAEYADAARMASLVTKGEEAQQIVTATEIQWASLWAKLQSYVPEGSRISGVAFQAPAPWETSFVPEGPLREPRVAVVTLEIAGDSYAGAALLVEKIPSLFGFSDVKIDKTELIDGEYRTTVKITLAADAVSGRYADEEADE
jgi:type II secretory pathway pseudopilin PulG